MVSDYLLDNPDIANNTLRKTRASTRSFINKFKLVYKHTKKNKIVYDFDGEEHSIHVETDEEYDKIVQISCGKGELSSLRTINIFIHNFLFVGSCDHQNIILNILAEQLKQEELEEEKLQNQSLISRNGRVKRTEVSVKRRRLSIENSENDPSSVNIIVKESLHETIQIKKKKKVIELPTDKLENVETLTMGNLMKKFGRGSFENFAKFIVEQMKANPSAISDANELTVEQADTKIWHELRIGRITASRFHEATRCTMTKGSLTEKFMGKSGGFSFAMMRGTVLEEFVFDEVKKEYPALQRSGLIINAEVNPFFAASPDGIHDDFVLEIKCPGTPNTFVQYTNIDKLSKKYFAQIQLQMHVTGKTKALLAVASLDFETTRNITKIWIPYDEIYVEEMKEQALEFYEKAIFPALKRKYLR